MSEHKWATTFVIAALALGCFWGRWLGHAEMKHWQDVWYAAHPVVAICRRENIVEAIQCGARAEADKHE